MRESTGAERLGMFQVAVLVLSFGLLLGLVADTFLKLSPELSKLLQAVDTAVCGVFLLDFCVQFYRSNNRKAFMKWGWIDLVASIPNLDVLRWGRVVRVLRVIRLLRGIRSIHRLFQMLLRNKLETGAVSLGLTAFLLIVFSASSILVVEQSASSNIRTAEDAVWWAVSTISTVGYGDVYPVTSEGRYLGMVLMVMGVGMFGGLSGLVASLFVQRRERTSHELEEVLRRLSDLQAKVDRLQKETEDPVP